MGLTLLNFSSVSCSANSFSMAARSSSAAFTAAACSAVSLLMLALMEAITPAKNSGDFSGCGKVIFGSAAGFLPKPDSDGSKSR